MFAEFSILEAVDNWSLDATPGDELDKAIREYGGEHKAKMLKRAVLRHVERIRCDRLSPLHPSHPPHPAAQFGSFKFGKVTAHSRDGVAKCFNFSGDPKGVITAESAKATTHSGVAIVADRGGSGTGCGAFKFEVGHADAHATGTGRASVYGVPEPDTPC
jgi:hypothetical protein